MFPRIVASLLAAALATEDCAALPADEVCALQMDSRRDLANVTKRGASKWLPTSIALKKLRRRYRHRGTAGHDNSGKLEGAAFADYSAVVTINGKKFEAIVDTGSSVFAVAARAGEGCKRYYTGHCTDTNISMQYGSGSWSGKICNGADVTFAGMNAGRPDFGGITEQRNFLNHCTKDAEGIVSQGIVGMAYPTLAMGYGITPLFDSVVEQTGVANIFGMQCCGWSGHHRAHGQINLGRVDSMLYTGELQYTPVTRALYFCVEMLQVEVSGAPLAPTEAPNKDDDCELIIGASCFIWGCAKSRGEGVYCQLGRCLCPKGVCASHGRCVPHSLLQANATRVPVKRADRLQELGALNTVSDEGRYSRYQGARSEGNCDTIVDSGTSELVFHDDIYQKVMGQIQEAAAWIPPSVSCITSKELSYFPDIVLTFKGGVTVRVPPSTYFQPKVASQCMVLFVGSGKGVPNIIGQPLMEAYYTVFDKEQGRVGFAPIAGCD